MPSIPSQMGWGPKNIYLKIFIAALAICFWSTRISASSGPLETVKTGTEKVLHILKMEVGNTEKRRAEIRKVVDEYFDFDEMAKRALGPSWKEQPPVKQQEYVGAFSQFLFNVYIDKIEKYTDEEITYETKGEKGGRATVDAIIAGSRTEKIAIEYRIHLRDGKWRVYDVVIEGVGLVNNYRSQFSSILTRSSIDDLLKQLKEKNLQNK